MFTSLIQDMLLGLPSSMLSFEDLRAETDNRKADHASRPKSPETQILNPESESTLGSKIAPEPPRQASTPQTCPYDRLI